MSSAIYGRSGINVQKFRLTSTLQRNDVYKGKKVSGLYFQIEYAIDTAKPSFHLAD